MSFRLGAVFLTGWLIHQQTLRHTENGMRPIRISEVKAFLPEAHRLRIRSSPNGGFRVIDRNRIPIGYVSRTMPHSRSIRGYSGPSDVLLVFDREERLLGIGIRHSYDTPSHVEDVIKDYHFMEQWNEKSRREIAGMQALPMTKFHIVSGASRTSEAVVQSVTLRAGIGEPGNQKEAGLQLRLQDFLLILCSFAGIVLTFAKWRWVQRRKFWIHILMVLYLGIVTADLLAQSLLISWAEHGIPWQQLPGLIVLAGVAFAIPWATGKPTYCTHLCPHGHVQRWLMKLIPADRKLHLGRDEKWSFAALPGLLLGTVLIISLARLPIDLAGLEPFDAWSIKGVGIATVLVAVIGLLFSVFVPMGYCRYACPTGFLLGLVKRERDGFRKRDWWLVGFIILAIVLYMKR